MPDPQNLRFTRFARYHERRRRIRRLASIGVLVVILMLLSRCMYYDYGVRADHPSVRYPSRYAGTKEDAYQFYTSVYRAREPDGGSIDIEVQHLVRKPGRDLSESRITVQYMGASRRLRVRPKSVRLEHRTRRGKLLRPSETRSDLGRCRRATTPGCAERFSHFYRPPRSKRLQERVRLEYELDGRPHVIDVTFPVEYRYHYSWWDVMQGI